MNRPFRRTLAGTAVTLGLAWSSAAVADEYDTAVRLCEAKIRDVYHVSEFRDAFAEREGNHKFMVHGKVKRDGKKYPFDCKVKNGHVKSYHYDGPHGHGDKDDSNLGAALAIGAGLAIVAAIAASAHDKDDKGDSHINKAMAEDDCHDELVYRMRAERHGRADVTLSTAKLHGRDLSGEGRVRFEQGRPHRFTYTCHLDRTGRVSDSSYLLY